MSGFFTRVIRWSFYLLFFLVPIVFTSNTSELFEFNKMWFTFGLTLIIAASWIGKMIAEKQIRIRKTLLDIPILVFLASQVVSTIFSIDRHTSLWGYYSRFNGGLYSLLSYGFLYFAFMSNTEKKDLMKYLFVGIASAVFVALWGLPSHFGYDPTCLLFRGTLDVSCWTFAFQPKVRIFSTLGQPDWLGAYLAYMIPLATGLGILFWKAKQKAFAFLFLGITALFYSDLLYTKARSGFVAFFVSLFLFLILFIAFQWRSFAKHTLIKAIKTHIFLLITLLIFAGITFIIGSPLSPLDKLSLSGLQSFLAAKQTQQAEKKAVPAPQITAPAGELGGTDSGKIRLFVWEGAWQVFLHYPVFGTGVETFAYSYYFFRPTGHNMTSEWDYLYNKAHNEFLNYLATTGGIGFLSYMLFITVSLWVMVKSVWQTKEITKQEHTTTNLFSSAYATRFLLLALLAGYVSILVTNFFGFSVVIMNIYLFLTPAFVLMADTLLSEKSWFVFPKNADHKITEIGWIALTGTWLVCLYFLIVLIRFWLADTSYAMGKNLDGANQFQQAYSYLHDAVATRPSEPAFQDELALNDAILATALYQQKDVTTSAKLKDEAIAVNNQLVTMYPRVVTYWKSRVRIFYQLSQIDQKYLTTALGAIEKAAELAPTDAKVWYNLGLLYNQTGQTTLAISVLQKTIAMKPDYRDAYYALALFYRQKALGGSAANKTVVNQQAEQQAVATMHKILKLFGPSTDLKIKETLASWGEK